jgi:signal transduction histidine kinase/CheY-like chemotaxis protein
MAIADRSSQYVVIHTPHGRDAEIAAGLLKEVGVLAVKASDLYQFEKSLSDDIWFALLTDEALRSGDMRGIAAWIANQPAWSDLPFIVLTQRGGGPERNPTAARLSEMLHNVTFLERPFHPTTFVSVARTALNGRRRQFDARALIADLNEGEERLRRANETLEARVAERTAELERAHALVLDEIAQREKAEALLRQAQKMEMIGQLTGGVAHDFNNLLMAVIGNLDLLRRYAPEDGKTRRLIDGAMQGAQRGATLTQRLLAFARRQELTVEARNPSDLMQGMSNLIAQSTGPEIELKFDVPEHLPPVMIDTNQIELAVLNLVVNARDAMPNGGTLSISTAAVHVDADDDLAPGTYIRLSVCDTGQGMDTETLGKATEPFFSTKELGKGTGLGLSMIDGLAKQLKGALRLSSEVGVGTQADLWLPAATSHQIQTPSPQAPAAELPGREQIKILFVDDDVLIAMSTVDMLEDLGHEVVEVNSGSSALQLLKDGQMFDLMITDYSMPRMTGAQLASAARALRPDLPILLATGYAELPSQPEIDLPRLAKPYQQAELATEIAKVLARGPGVNG